MPGSVSSVPWSQPVPAGHRPWLWPNLLSLDAPLIAVLWLNLFAISGQVRVRPAATIVLALVVWAIYIADRLLDTLHWSGGDEGFAARHRFYRQHRAGFALFLLPLLGVICWFCCNLDRRTLRDGILMLAAVTLYFAAIHYRRSKSRLALPKEATVAVLFGAGTYLPAWAHARSSNAGLDVSVLLFVLLCWVNAALIEYSEWIRLRLARWRTPHASTVAAGKYLLAIGIAVAVLALCLAAAPAFHAELPILAAVALSALALAGLGFCWRRLAIDQVRVLADATLLTPGVILLLLHR